ncbi:SDR family oxidoreductase [bacterium]|nr:SDR family oxidoreductase [bacterium]
MMSPLNGKVALVTGASRGFGRAIARRLAADGATVVVNYRRSMSEAAETVDDILASGGRAVAIRADMANEEKIVAMLEQIKSEFNRLDILVSNASFGIPGKILESKSKYWDMTMDATAKALLLLALHSAPLMTHGGHMVVISSYGHRRILPGYGVVGPAKGAVEALTRSLAVELAPKGIVVNGVMPGLSPTKSLLAVPGADESIAKALRQTPMGRLISPDEVAGIVRFLVSGLADMIVGQLIVADGGAILT